MTTVANDGSAQAGDDAANHLASDPMQQIFARSATDARFRQSLLSAPRQALAEFYGVDESSLPPGTVAFVENKAGATFVLPDFVAADDTLSEGELESVAGGSPPLLVVAAGVLWGADITLAAYLIGRGG